jgi:hypothetical protein
MNIENYAEELTTYAEFDSLVVEPFFAGRYQSTIILGRPGLSKSHRFAARLDDKSHLIKGWAKPVQTLIDVYRHRNKLLIFDDAESLWKTELGRVLIRSLTENTPHKNIQANTTNKDLQKASVPTSFVTSSRCAFLINNFRFGSSDEFDAIMDRSHVFNFNPTALEVHVDVGQWLWPQAQDIYDFVGERLHLLHDHSARTYLKLWDRKQAGLDWKQMLYNRFCLAANAQLVQQLESDWRISTVEKKVAKFREMGGGERSTYFYIKRKLKHAGQLQPLDPSEVPRVTLAGETPEEVDLERDVAEASGATPASEPGEAGERFKDNEEEEETDRGLNVHEAGRSLRAGWQELRSANPPDDMPERERLLYLLKRAHIRGDGAMYDKLERQLRELDGHDN